MFRNRLYRATLDEGASLSSSAWRIERDSRGRSCPPDQAYGGVLVGDAAALVERAQQVLAAAVLVERDDGADWSEIAAALGLTVEEVLSRWELAHHEWSQTRPGCPVDAAAVEQARAGELAALDAWVIRHREPGDPDAGAAPVSAVMTRQHLCVERRIERGDRPGRL